MKNLIRKVNTLLLLLTLVLALTLVGSHYQARAQDDLNDPAEHNDPVYTTCETVIDMTSNCGYYWWGPGRTICKTDGTWCCEYTAHDKFCFGKTEEQIVSGGYKAWFNAEIPNLACGGQYGSICQ